MRRPALHITVTEAHLQRAWHQWKRPDWPATFAEAKAHPMYGRLLRTAAIGLAVGEQRPRSMPSSTVTPPPAQPAAAPPARPRQAALFDPKRLASGERDDD